MKYIRLSENYNKNILIPASDSPYKHINGKYNSPWFTSMLTYDQTQYDHWMNTKSLAGLSGSKTNKLWFDFDGSEVTGASVEQAVKDARTCCTKLLANGAKEENLQICFSGNKGIGIIVETDKEFTNTEVKTICQDLSSGLTSFDGKMYDNQRIFRLPFTKNEKSNLYKIPLTLEELNTLSLTDIKLHARDIADMDIEAITNYYKPMKFNMKLNSPAKVVKSAVIQTSELDFSKKPKFLSNCRWALQNGKFKEGSRSSALLCLASTYKNLGFDLEHTYRLLKGVCEMQSKTENCDRFPDEEVYNNICLQVYGPSWMNGQYSCHTEGWLKDYCDGLNEYSCAHTKSTTDLPHNITEVKDSFKHYVKNIDSNTIHMGLPSIDNNVFISTGANVMIIGAAGSGKTSLILNILEHTGKAGVKSVFASLDMAKNRMFEKVLYKVTGLPRKDLYEIFAQDPVKEAAIMEQVKEQYGNAFFFSKSCPTVEDIKNYILDCQEVAGEKIKLVVLDYFERISSDFSDDTQSSKKIAGELQDLVNDLDIALITLVQPNKFGLSGGVDQPIYDYTKIKGSSFVYQSARIILSMWRPFYSPKDFSKDKYMQMAVLKNDLGELAEFSFKWDGKRGKIEELEDFELETLNDQLRQKNEEKNNEKGSW